MPEPKRPEPPIPPGRPPLVFCSVVSFRIGLLLSVLSGNAGGLLKRGSALGGRMNSWAGVGGLICLSVVKQPHRPTARPSSAIHRLRMGHLPPGNQGIGEEL